MTEEMTGEEKLAKLINRFDEVYVQRAGNRYMVEIRTSRGDVGHAETNHLKHSIDRAVDDLERAIKELRSEADDAMKFSDTELRKITALRYEFGEDPGES